MSVMLSNKTSKFACALSALLPGELGKKVEFRQAVISDDGSNWDLRFYYSELLSEAEKRTFNEALDKIIPATVKREVSFDAYPAPIKPIPFAHPGENEPNERAIEGLTAYSVPVNDDVLKTVNDNKAASATDTNEESSGAYGGEISSPDEYAPLPEDCDAPLPDDLDAPASGFDDTDGAEQYGGAEGVENDSDESALDRFRRRQEQMQREAAEKAKEFKAAEKPQKKTKGSLSKDGNAIVGKVFTIKELTPIKDLTEYSKYITIAGDVFGVETKEIKTKSVIITFSVTDYTSSISCKLFADNQEIADEVCEKLKGRVVIEGICAFDDYIKEITVRPRNIMGQKTVVKCDNAPKKRIEMHLHTKMSQMDGVVDAGQLVKLMMQYGHDTVAITDHGVVQAYPDMEEAIAKNKADIKLILGVEGYLLDDNPIVEFLPPEAKLKEQKYCCISLRTGGSSTLTSGIIEIGACILNEGVVQTEVFHSYINPHCAVDREILTESYITEEMLASAPELAPVMERLNAFSEGCALVLHNAGTLSPFLDAAFRQAGIDRHIPVIDTLRLSRELIPTIKSGKLNKVCDALEIKAGDITDASKEAGITAVIWKRLLEELEKRKVYTVGGLNDAVNTDNGESYHIIIYAKNKKGLFNLYSLITESHLHHLRRKRPQMPRSCITAHREGLLIASACEAGELYRAMLKNASEERLEQIASFYDYLEVQPLGNNEFLVRDGFVKDKEALIELNKRIIALGEKLNKPVIATGDVHYLKPEDSIFRSVIMCAEGFSDADKQAPLYYRTTEEMLAEFYYLDEAKRREIVIDNPRMIADLCDKMESFPRDHLYTPEMEHAEEDLREMCEKKAHDMYGEVLPEIVAKRLEKELTAIIKNGYAVLYLIAHKVVKKSLSDGYLVGSRGSVGSSFAATMADITEVNPLTPHYLCPECKYSDFDIDLNKYDCGIDMPKKNCPNCGAELLRLGFNIPFEVFMGFDGDKVPDIDLNFSGVYQPVVHKYIEELFGSKYVFRAGTIGGVADKTAYGYAKKYSETFGLGKLREAELTRMASGCIDVKRTTGQHAGGVVILPKKYDINEFTPLQYPANDPSQGIITTHFTFKSLHDTILKADILGHDDPTVIRMLEDMTGIDAKKDVPLDDPKVMGLFLSPEPLGVTSEEIGSKTGTFGIPEFGTGFTMQMLEDTKPTTFSDLVKISGLSHGTDVWMGNAKDLIDNGVATISQCICTREDIMNGLLLKNVSNFTSFDTMEKVRKGKGIPEKYLAEIREHGVPEWFIESCNKIKYMFPKAHAAAYVTMALRIAWFKVYKPHQYYATYFSVRADDFEISIASMSIAEIRQKIKESKAIPHPNPREKGILVMMEIVLEMKCRGVEFTAIDIYKSEAMNFTVTEDNLIRPPLNAVPGLGENAAKSIVEARKLEMFKSQDDLLLRTKLSTTLLKALDDCGCLKNLPKSQQISLFDF